jgi:hypothetical protein
MKDNAGSAGAPLEIWSQTVENSPPPRRTGLAAAMGVLAAIAIGGGVVVLNTSGGAPQPSTVAAPLSAPLELPAGSSESALALSQGSQLPGTVLLPAGGTAELVRTEVTADAVLPIPKGLGEAAWWGAKLGAEHGAALLSGHVNWAGKKGPFDELWSMRSGQDVSVVDKAGGHWVYRVTGVVTLRKEDLPAQALRLFGQDGPHRLVLVTCGGDVGGTDGYRDNRIVTAGLVSHP